jgi:hypothetical protein
LGAGMIKDVHLIYGTNKIFTPHASAYL